jgi:hypothetical protein
MSEENPELLRRATRTFNRGDLEAGRRTRGMEKRRFREVLAFALVIAATALLASGCGGDDDDDTATEAPGTAEAAALYEEIADLPDEEQIERVGAAWPTPFAAGNEAMCGYLHPDLGCNEQFLAGALTGSIRIQKSYAGATVTDVKINGETATAEFSNGERVEFKKDSDGRWKISAVSR